MLDTGAIDTATKTSITTCETPRNPTLAADVPIDEEVAIALDNCTCDMIGKEAIEKILHYAFWKGCDQEYKIGYDKGYHEAAEYGILMQVMDGKQKKLRDMSLAWKKGSRYVEMKHSKARKKRRNESTKMVGEKVTKLDSKKGRKNGK